MNDQDIIREAIELADGWEENWDGVFCDEMSRMMVFGRGLPARQWQLDALAAQLVRQVDALEKVEFSCNHHGTAVIIDERDRSSKCTGRNESPDRTMNTLRAIVESGVLKK